MDQKLVCGQWLHVSLELIGRIIILKQLSWVQYSQYSILGSVPFQRLPSTLHCVGSAPPFWKVLPHQLLVLQNSAHHHYPLKSPRLPEAEIHSQPLNSEHTSSAGMNIN